MTADHSSPTPSLFEEHAQAVRRGLVRMPEDDGGAYVEALDGLDSLLGIIDWLLPAVAERSRYGVSSCKMLRHCLLDEPLDTWHRPYDAGDLVGATRTARAAPDHLREKANRAIAEWREALEPHYVKRADAELAGEIPGSGRVG